MRDKREMLLPSARPPTLFQSRTIANAEVPMLHLVSTAFMRQHSSSRPVPSGEMPAQGSGEARYRHVGVQPEGTKIQPTCLFHMSVPDPPAENVPADVKTQHAIRMAKTCSLRVRRRGFKCETCSPCTRTNGIEQRFTHRSSERTQKSPKRAYIYEAVNAGKRETAERAHLRRRINETSLNGRCWREDGNGRNSGESILFRHGASRI